jgi:hypothetical protein
MYRIRIALALLTTSSFVLAANASAAGAVKSTYYFHGGPSGNAADLQAAAAGTGSYLPMDAQAPTSPISSEFGFGSIAGNPSSNCVGDPTGMVPTWTGRATGTLVKKVVVTAYARSLPGGRVKVNLFTDLKNAALCGASYPAPAASATTSLPESVFAPTAVADPFTTAPVTVTLLLPKPVAVKGSFTIQFQPDPTLAPFQGSSIVFDGTPTPSGMTWTCIPAAGKKSCTG